MNEISLFNQLVYQNGLPYKNQKDKLRDDHQIRIEKMLDFVELHASNSDKQKEISILDIGCYDGFFGLKLKERGFNNISCLDIIPEAIALANKRGINAVCADASKSLPCKTESIDLIVAGEIIEHLYDPKQFLQNVYSVLSRNGGLIITVPNLCSLRNRYRVLKGNFPFHYNSDLNARFGEHIRLFNLKSIKELLHQTGFMVKKVSSNGLFGRYQVMDLYPDLGDILIVYAQKK